MITNMSRIPKFYRGQSVCFVGGEGVVQNYQREAESWAYQVEMALGLEPDCGRVGDETTVVLSETELEVWFSGASLGSP
jgi:hypothetical protein